MSEFLKKYVESLQQADAIFFVAFGLFFIIIYFLPARLAVFFNRVHLRKIAVLNIPAGFSLIAWGALLIWACTGKVEKVLQHRLKRNATHNTP